ncbi:glycosyltransferase 87 family protein [Aldersonia sp. NBC_00410]|uniref:glycosyltransferase family 87 protein n=1 Tax=Aldersonia sp. NBC_00410 TaxID=2975954 RepID=UPI002259BC7C|nr:glycosyltransferase 87 family protein [Aldersonia sp. NBC_00410]MCX5044920.1 glycosyltransferase 87 family protein [Aldersonia sp. NBC_00410]
MRRVAAADRKTIAAVVALCGITLLLGYLNKARCAGPPFDADGRSLVFDRIKDARVCYSDIQYLWVGRDIDHHVFPYIDGGITAHGQLFGGTVEYPVLSGLLMWLGARGAHTDADFLLNSAVLLAPFALVTAWLLARLAGRAALLWAIGPALVLYAFHNWELPVVLTTVAAVAVVALPERLSLRTRGVLAAVLLGVGFCLKLYPGVFVLPLALFVLTGGLAGRDLPRSVAGRYDVRGAVLVVVSAVGTAVAINLPFALTGFRGWLASFTFQQQRTADITTNSIWYWGLRNLYSSDATGEAAFQHTVSLASPALLVAAFALAAWLGWRRFTRTGSYPWVQVSGAMLCAFVLLHKVHSPQYSLWLIPFLVLLVVPWRLVVAFVVTDLALGVGVFRYFNALAVGAPSDGNRLIVEFGVWGQAIVLVALYVAFLRADTRRPKSIPPEPAQAERSLVATARGR